MRPVSGEMERERREEGGGQVPGAPCDGTPHRHGDMGQGACGGGALGEGTCSEQRGGRALA